MKTTRIFLALMFLFSTIALAQKYPDRIKRGGGQCIVKSDGSIECTPAPGKSIIMNGLTIGVQCAGVNDATALNAANALGGTIVISRGVTCAADSTVAISSTLRVERGGLFKAIASTVPVITGDIDGAGDGHQIFTNALPVGGNGTISFTGNTVITYARAEWWGASPSATPITNGRALNAASNALETIGAGDVVVGTGTFQFNATVTLGNDSSFTGIGLRGTNGQVGTTLQWMGATNLPAIKVSRGRFNHVRDVGLLNGVARGTTQGWLLTGPGTGTQTAGVTFERVHTTGFDIGTQLGESGSRAASEFTATQCVWSSNRIGLYLVDFNTLNINLFVPQFAFNTEYGLYSDACGWSVHGGAGAENGIATFRMNQAGTPIRIENFRDELTAAGTGVFFLGYSAQADQTIEFSGDHFTPSAAMTLPMISASGQVRINGAGVNGSNPFALYGDYIGGAAPNLVPQSNSSIEITNCDWLDTNPLLFTTLENSGQDGLRYRFFHNHKHSADGTGTGFYIDEKGIVDWPRRLSEETLLATVKNVDMNTATATTLFTVPTGRTVTITKVIVRNASTSLTTASWSYGFSSPTYNDVIADATHTGLVNTQFQSVLPAKDAAVQGLAGSGLSTFKVIMNTLQGGAATTTMDVYGYYLQ
jgi:hypothetical protein